MIALNCNRRYALLFEPPQTFNCVQQCLRINRTLVKQITCDHQKINLPCNSLIHDIPKGTAEIVKTFSHTILLIAKMGISYMDKRSLHAISFFPNSSCLSQDRI